MKNLLLISATLALSFGSMTSHADDGFFSLERHNEITAVTDKDYIDECGSCHFPYQPGLLPEGSWQN